MGKKLAEMYNHIKANNGEIGLYRLIVKTRISPEFAQQLEDSEENINLVQKAIEDLGFTYTKAEERKTRRSFLQRFFRRNRK